MKAVSELNAASDENLKAASDDNLKAASDDNLKAASGDDLKAASGAKPAGAEDESSAAQMVRQMFNSIAPRYDLLNHVL